MTEFANRAEDGFDLTTKKTANFNHYQVILKLNPDLINGDSPAVNLRELKSTIAGLVEKIPTINRTPVINHDDGDNIFLITGIQCCHDQNKESDYHATELAEQIKTYIAEIMNPPEQPNTVSPQIIRSLNEIDPRKDQAINKILEFTNGDHANKELGALDKQARRALMRMIDEIEIKDSTTIRFHMDIDKHRFGRYGMGTRKDIAEKFSTVVEDLFNESFGIKEEAIVKLDGTGKLHVLKDDEKSSSYFTVTIPNTDNITSKVDELNQALTDRRQPAIRT